jgi:hypothetical protein
MDSAVGLETAAMDCAVEWENCSNVLCSYMDRVRRGLRKYLIRKAPLFLSGQFHGKRTKTRNLGSEYSIVEQYKDETKRYLHASSNGLINQDIAMKCRWYESLLL